MSYTGKLVHKAFDETWAFLFGDRLKTLLNTLGPIIVGILLTRTVEGAKAMGDELVKLIATGLVASVGWGVVVFLAHVFYTTPKGIIVRQKALQEEAAARSGLAISNSGFVVESYGKRGVAIAVLNKSKDKSADDVKMTIVEVDPALKTERDGLVPWNVPVSPPDGVRPSINPGDALAFTIGTLSIYEPDTSPNYTLKIYDDPQSHYLRLNPEKTYRLKIRATARDFPECVTEFEMNLIGTVPMMAFMITERS